MTSSPTKETSLVPRPGNTPASPKTPAASTSNPISPPPPNVDGQLANIDGRLSAIEQTLKPSGTDAKLAVIEQLIRDIKPTSLVTTLMPSVIAFIGALGGVLIGGYVNERLQRARLTQEAKIADDKATHEKELASAKAKQDRELSEKQTKLQIGNAVIDWEIKQLSLLYGPLRALLGQSRALYAEMNAALVQQSPLFRLFGGEDGTKKPEFQIQTSSGEWRRFRTVIDIFEVYGQGYGVEVYFDEIVSIGAEMVKVIQQQAGYARAEEKEVIGVFGNYLAHFAVLKAMHEAAKARVGKDPSSKTVPAPSVNISAAFPEVIHVLINQGFNAISEDIEKWRQQAAA
jgi:hypothetical protein